MSEQQAEYVTDLEDAAALMGWSDPGPKETESVVTVSGYTPAPDDISQKFGYVTAMVWGRMWRYCQMKDGMCRAKLETIAKELGMSERTIIRHIDKLVIGGYFVDKTPDLKNKPHLYADTGKVRLAFSSEVRVTESQPAMTESQRQGDRESVEDSNKRGKNKLSGDEIQKIKASADRAVDAVLDGERKSLGKSWSLLPEVYHSYGKAFCAATGLNYHKKYLMDWIATFDEWQLDGYQPQDVYRAVDACRGKTDISRPGSITFKLRAQKVVAPLFQEQEVIY